MKRITSNVYAETQWTSGTQASGGSTSSFVTTSAGIVMIDAPLVPANAVKWRDMIAGKGEGLCLINTEYHADHTLGDYFFLVPIISHEETRKSIPEALGKTEDVRKKVQEQYPDSLPLVENYEVRLPNITFSNKLSLYFGEHTFELIHLPGHTLGQIAVYVPQEKVVFTGDNFSNGFKPALSYCYPLEWLDSLEKILELDAEAFIPGHGEVGDRKSVREFKVSLKRCVNEVQEAIAKGLSKEEAGNRIQFDVRLAPRHPGREQEKKDIGRLYDMLSNR